MSLKILLITSRRAYPYIRRAVDEARRYGCKHEVELLVLPIEVAALLRVEDIRRMLIGWRDYIRKFDLVMVSGLIRGSLSELSREFGVRFVKGTSSALSLSLLLSLDDRYLLSLSEDKSAEYVLRKVCLEECVSILRECMGRCRDGQGFYLGPYCIYPGSPPIVVSCVRLDSRGLDERLLSNAAKHGDVLCLSIDPETPSDVVRRWIDYAETFGKALAVEASNPKHIDLVIDRIDALINVPLQLLNYISRKDLVISIPLVMQDVDPVEAGKRIISYANSMGFYRVVLDPILYPPPLGFFSSLMRLYSLSKSLPVPTQISIANLVEMVDADSIGMIALATGLAVELGVSLIVVYESWGRHYGSSYEASIARCMALVAQRRSRSMTGLGLELFVAKDRCIEIPDVALPRGTKVVEVEKVVPSERDEIGFFRIWVDHTEDRIHALYSGKKGFVLVKGRKAMDIGNEIARRGLVSSYSHAIYLGYELCKAEIALLLGKNYRQDMKLFRYLGEEDDC